MGEIMAGCVTSRGLKEAAGVVGGLGVPYLVVGNGVGVEEGVKGVALFPVNIGCPAATNFLFQYAVQAGYEFLLRVDDDVEVLTGAWRENCLEIMRADPKCAVVGAKILQPDVGRTGHCNCRVTKDGWVLRSGLGREAGPVCARNYVSFVTGVFMVFRLKAVLEIGGMDLLFTPSQCDDVDYGMRAWKKGWRVVYDGKTEVLHKSEPAQSDYRTITSAAHTVVLHLKYGGNFLAAGAEVEAEIDRMGREFVLGPNAAGPNGAGGE